MRVNSGETNELKMHEFLQIKSLKAKTIVLI